MTAIKPNTKISLKKADWELDFYSRPITEKDGKKRWEVLISSTEDFSGEKPFRWAKNCPSGMVNSTWLATALQEALNEAIEEGWAKPSKLRFWRPSMRTIIKKASEKVGIDPVSSRRTYSLSEWLDDRTRDFYPNEVGYIAGPLAPTFSPISNQSVPLPEAIRGDAWSFATLSVSTLREASDWPIEFSGLVPIKETIKDNIQIPGIRLFSKSRSLGLAAWLGGLEPVALTLENLQLVLEAGLDERWLVTDMEKETADYAHKCFKNSKTHADGLQFIAVQSTPEDEKFAGFWMLREFQIN